MAKREKKPVHKVVMTEGKRQIIQQLLQEYDIETAEDIGYTGALKAPVRCFGNHLSRKRKSLFRTDDECGGAAILKKMLFRMGRQLIGYYYSLNAGSSPYTSLMER